MDLELSKTEFKEVMNVLRRPKKNDLRNKGDILLDAILRSSKSTIRGYNCEKALNLSSGIFLERNKRKCVKVLSQNGKDACVSSLCDNISCDIKKDSISDSSINDIYIDMNCDKVKRKKTENKMRDISNVFSLEYLEKRQKVKVKQKITFEEETNEKNNNRLTNSSINSSITSSITNNLEKSVCEALKSDCEAPKGQGGIGIPTASDQAKFRKNLDSAASMVFHSRTGLPLTSSPAPVRRGKSCFDFDSSINSVSAIRR